MSQILDNSPMVPPHSIQAEQSVLGALLLDNSAYDRIADSLVENDFYRYDHRLIFQHIVKLINRCKPADVVTVYESLQGTGKAEEVGGLSYLNDLSSNTPSAANIRHYADIVRSAGACRQLIAVADEISVEAFAWHGKDSKQIVDAAESKILAINERATTKGVGIQSLITQAVERIDELYNRDDQSGITGTATGFADIDRLTSGMQAGDLIIVAGRPSMGKTSFAMNIGENVAIKSGLPVVVFSMEMGGAQLATRMLGSVGRLDQQRLRVGHLEDHDWPKMTQAIQLINDARIHIDDSPALNYSELRSRARRQAKEFGKLGLIIIDYLQLMSANSAGENRATEISEISRNLKGLAKELNCPVIALSQLNRSLENRPNKRPVMSDLRESGAIEQDADVIMFIYRDEVYDSHSQDAGTAEIIIGKQRNGPIGTVRLAFNGAFTKFEDLAPSWHPEPPRTKPLFNDRGFNG